MTTSSMAQMGDQQQSTIDNIGTQADDLKEKAAFIWRWQDLPKTSFLHLLYFKFNLGAKP